MENSKTTEELSKEYTDDLIKLEEYLFFIKEVFKKVEPLRKKLADMEDELVKRGVKIKNVGT